MRSPDSWKKLFFLFLSIAFFIAGNSFSYAQSVQVSEIRIEGNRRIGTDSVELLISQKAGEIYDESLIAEDIKKIYSTGDFYDVSVEKEVSGSGVILTYTLKENPVLVDLSFSGNKNLKDEKINEALEIQANQIVSTAEIKAEAEKITELYAVKGYGNARVSYNIEPEEDGRIRVAYKVDEGERETISSVKIKGNINIKTKSLSKRIFSSPRKFYSLGARGLFIREEIEKDSERIKYAYLDEGYLDAKVSPPKFKYDKPTNSYEITFEIDEGPQYFVSEISLEGIEPPPEVNEKEILYKISLKKGEPYGNSKLSSDINFVTSIYSNKGYADVNVDPVVVKQSIPGGKPGVAVTLRVEKGELFRINRITIVGNDKTVDKFIRRQIPIAEGDIYESDSLALIKPLVGRSGFFDSGSIQVTTERSRENPNELDVTVAVTETSTAQFNLGAGVSSVEDFIFFGSIREGNLFGYGNSLEATANFGDITDTYALRYRDGNFLDTDWTFDASVSRVERDYTDYDTDSIGFTVGVGRSLYSQLWGRIYYRWEDLKITNPSPAAIAANIRSSSGLLSAVGAEISWDSRDNFLFPRSGYRTILVYEYTGPFGGDTDLSKLAFETNTWIPVFKGSFLSLKMGYDRVWLRGGQSNAHAVDERLFLGGSYDLRGYEYREIAVGGTNSALGGTERIYGKADFVIPLIESIGLFGILFYDIGNVFDPEQGFSFSVDPGDLRKDFGYGFWWRSPLGLIKIEIGYPVDRRPFEDKSQVNFSIGASF